MAAFSYGKPTQCVLKRCVLTQEQNEWATLALEIILPQFGASTKMPDPNLMDSLPTSQFTDLKEITEYLLKSLPVEERVELLRNACAESIQAP